MSKLISFQFDTATVRVITADSGEVLFVAKDVATALGYTDTVNAVKAHCKKSKSLKDIGMVNHHPQQNQKLANLDPQIKIIPESDVFRLIMRSKLTRAEEFQDWVCEEVLPTIRKTGSYGFPEFLKPITEPISLGDFEWRRDVIYQAFENLEKAQVSKMMTLSGKELLAGKCFEK
jgi:prophage antirepressor-like protein